MDAKIWNFSGWIKETDKDKINTTFDTLLVKAGFGVLNKIEQDFEPQGFTALWLLAESHFAVHTFPENGNSYIELSSCNEEKQKTFLTILDFEIYQYQENISLGEN